MNRPRPRAVAVTAALLTATLALAACGSEDSTDTTAAATGTSAAAATSTATTAATGTRTVTADNGTIEVPADPQRIVTIGNTGQPILDLGGEPVGATDISDSTLGLLPEEQQAAFAAATKLGPEGGEVDLEKVASLKPDLILVQLPDEEFESIATELEAIAPTAFYGLDTEWKGFAGKLAEAGNLTDQLDAQKTAFTDKIAKIQDTYGDVIENTSFVDISRGDWQDPGLFYIADIGCSEVGRDDVGLDLPEAAAGKDPLAYADLPFEQLTSLTKYDVITYPVDAEGRPTESFAPVTETNTWKALPAVKSGKALGVFCPGNGSYGQVNRYLDSLDSALATLSAKE